MAGEPDSQVAILAIKPMYSQQILNGDKRVEFRKVAFKQPVSHVVIYESAPTSQIVGFFTVSEIVAGSPTAIWRRFSKVGGISRRDFRSYYKGTRVATAIVVESTVRLAKKVPLTDLNRNYRPPQSFMYASASDLKTLLGAAEECGMDTASPSCTSLFPALCAGNEIHKPAATSRVQ